MMTLIRRRLRLRSQGGSVGRDDGPPPDVATLAQQLARLDERLQQLRRAVDNLAQLAALETATEANQVRDRPAMADAIHRIQQELDTYEQQLAAQFFSWEQVKEPFWQAVRFGGLGMVVGWVLAQVAG